MRRAYKNNGAVGVVRAKKGAARTARLHARADALATAELMIGRGEGLVKALRFVLQMGVPRATALRNRPFVQFDPAR